MTEILRSLPENHPQRGRIMKRYQAMMSSLLRFQCSDGLWRQLLDHPEAWPDTSCSAMFTFAMAAGVKDGWLDAKKYGSAARKGWLGLVSYLEPNGDIRNVCEGTNKLNDLNYYLTRKRNTGDLHGQAPLLWCVTEFSAVSEGQNEPARNERQDQERCRRPSQGSVCRNSATDSVSFRG